MKVKIVPCLFFLLNTFLFATYYSVSKEALGRIEPIIFSFIEMVTLLPAGICILILTRKDVSKALVKRGVLVGSWLCLALFTIAIALKYTSATSTAFFPSLNGLLAALIAWLFFRQPIGKVTWFAGSISMIGTVLLISNSSMGGWRGMSIAFLGGLFFTCYVFLADHQQQGDLAPWPLFGIELVTMAGWSMLIALLFGNWQSFHPTLPKDIWVILYVAGATTFLPTLITVLMQKYVSPVTVSFIYILEPILGAIVANLYLHEMLPVQCLGDSRYNGDSDNTPYCIQCDAAQRETCGTTASAVSKASKAPRVPGVPRHSIERSSFRAHRKKKRKRKHQRDNAEPDTFSPGRISFLERPVFFFLHSISFWLICLHGSGKRASRDV